MKRFAVVAAAIGGLVIAGAIWAADPRAVAGALAEAGAAGLLVIAVRAVSVTLAGLAWWLLLPQAEAPPPRICALLRVVREGGNTLLPFTQIGGDVIAARLMTFWGVAGALAAASMIVDVLLQAATQFLFAIAGLGMLAAGDGASPFIHDISIALLLAVPALGGFYLVQRKWGEALVGGVLRRLARGQEWAVHGTVDALFQQLHTIYERRGPVFAAFVSHLAIWFVGALEVWIGLSAMGYDIDFRAAIAIEGLAQAARGAAFMVPGAVGVQEGGLIVLCGLYGVPADAALALSLLKRAADLCVGGPGLIAWHYLEASRFVRRRASVPD